MCRLQTKKINKKSILIRSQVCLSILKNMNEYFLGRWWENSSVSSTVVAVSCYSK